MKAIKSEHRSDWGRLLLWTPLLVGGVVAAIFATRAARLRRTLRRLWEADSRVDEQTRQQLRLAIIGNDKATIAAVFGPPRTTVRHGAQAAAAVESLNATATQHASSNAHYFAADTWYYPYDPAQQRAVVIEFDRGGVAREAQFFQSPVAQIPRQE